MRLLIKQYTTGKAFAVEVSNDGTVIRKKLKGEREAGQDLSAYVEVLCDDNVSGADRLIEALNFLKDEVVKRKKVYAKKKNGNKKNEKKAVKNPAQ